MVAVPIVNSGVGLLQRWWASRVGEGIIFDLRRQLYEHLQAMSLRFFTATKTGELISRLNSDVVGAQQAITGTFVSILSNFVSVAVILVVMLRENVLLTVLAVAALPLFVIPAKRVARLLRQATEEQMEHNATMSAILQETFNVSGALLVKLFNRGREESSRFGREAGAVRDLGVRRAMIGRWFFAAVGLVSAVGTAVVFWVGGYLVIDGSLTIGTVVMFSTLVAQLYGPLSAISNSRVEFATSLVSFERVFEILDLATDLPEDPNPVVLSDVAGKVEFDDVSFTYRSGNVDGLDAVKRGPWNGDGPGPVARAGAGPRGVGARARLVRRRAGGARRSRRAERGGEDDDQLPGAPALRRHHRRGPHRRTRRPPDSPSAPSPRRSGSSPRRRTSSTTRSPPTSGTPSPTPASTSSRRPAGRRTSTTSSPRSPRGTTPSSASGGTGCRAARSSGSPSPGSS